MGSSLLALAKSIYYYITFPNNTLQNAMVTWYDLQICI